MNESQTTGCEGTDSNPMPVAGQRPYMTRESMLLDQVILSLRHAREMEPWPNLIKVIDALDLAKVWLMQLTSRT